MDKQFISWLNQEILYEKFLSRSVKNEKMYNTAIPLKTYVAGKTTLVRNSRGEEVLAKSVFYLDGASAPSDLSVNDRFTYEGVELPVMLISKYYDENGNLDVVEVYV